MADNLKLLVVEDSEPEVGEWKKAVERHNVMKDRQFDLEVTYASSKSEAEKKIQTHRFDAAVVDLRLKLDGAAHGQNDDGNEVVKTLAAAEMAAVVVYTGQRADVSKFDSPNIVVLEKGSGLDVAFDWLNKQWDIILAVQKANAIIGNDMARTFHRSVWPRWQQWQEGEKGQEKVVLPLARHFVSHVYTQLIHQSERVHPEEHYYVPPVLKNQLSTGDLIKSLAGIVEVIITPRCDCARDGKVETVQLAECVDISETWNKLQQSGSASSQEKIGKYKQHERKEVQHFIPAMTMEPGKLLGPWFVRFDRVRSVDKTSDEYKALIDHRFASISTDFLPSLVQRLGAFFSRFGAPDLL